MDIRRINRESRNEYAQRGCTVTVTYRCHPGQPLTLTFDTPAEARTYVLEHGTVTR